MGVQESWAAIHQGMDKLIDNWRAKLHGPAKSTALAKLEKLIGHKLPDDFKACYRLHDGSDYRLTLLAGLPLLSLNEITRAWESWATIADDTELNAEISEGFQGHPGDAVKPLYANRGWLPFAGDGQNFAALDFDPGPSGEVGQVINAGRDDETRYVIADSFSSFLAFVAEQFERGRVVLKHGCPRLFVSGKDRDFLQALPYTLGLKPEEKEPSLSAAEAAAEKAIKELGGVVQRSGHFGNPDVDVWLRGPQVTDVALDHLKDVGELRSLDLRDAAVTDTGIKALKDLTTLKTLSLGGTQITDRGLKELKNLKSLQTIWLDNTRVTGAGFEDFKGFENLNCLDLRESPVTDDGLRAFRALKNVRTLYLMNTKVTDAGVKELKEVTRLEDLYLGGTQITDAGLKELKDLQNLRRLDLSSTKVAMRGLKVLQAALPGIQIHK
jgi:cell wall assembly regulator SMI1